MPLEPPDTHYYLAAIGWLELGNPQEALEELNHISPEGENDPDVIELRLQIYSEFKEWELMLKYSERLVSISPNRPSGWINRSYALHELKQTASAYNLLLPAADKFPRIFTIPYNLSCYSCQLGKIEEAINWFKKALAIAENKDELKSMALSDKDLEPLWKIIQNL
ncbi:MAG: tetratricopeptide repeat protein [Limisphaerales bacterium]|jgi:tetratricopeptide (TPR) repeat protein